MRVLKRLHLPIFLPRSRLSFADRSCSAVLHISSSPKLSLLHCKHSGIDMATAPNPHRDLGPGEQLSMDQWGWKIPLRSSKPALPDSPLNHKCHIHVPLNASRDEDSHFQCDPTWWRFLSQLRVIFQSDKTCLVDSAQAWVRW